MKIKKYQKPAGNLPKIKDFAKRVFNKMNSVSQQASENMRDVHTGGLHSTIKELQDEGKYEEAQDLSKKYLTASATGLTLPLMASEFTTYGLLGGGFRLGSGFGVGYAGEKGLGYIGDKIDEVSGTNWVGPTSRVIGSFAGFGIGSNLANRGLRTLAGQGITMRMPQDTFMKLRGEEFIRTGNKAVKSLLNNKHEINPETRLMKQIVDVPEGKGWQFHIDDFFKHIDRDIDTGRVISTSNPKQHIVGNRFVPGESPWGSENNYIWFKEDKPYVNPYHSNILKGLSSHLETKYNLPVNGEPNRFPLTRGFNVNAPSIESYEYVPLNVVKVRDSWNHKLFRNEITGTWGRVKYYTPTSSENGSVYWGLFERPSKITPSERAGIPKGERKYLVNWEGWSKGGPISQRHLTEYALIDNNLWRNKFKPKLGLDRRSIIQLQSKDAKKLDSKILYTGVEEAIDPNYNGILWTTRDGLSARAYATTDDGVMQIVIPKTTRIKSFDANKKSWYNLLGEPRESDNGYTTNKFADQAFHEGFDVAEIKNVIDIGPNYVPFSTKYNPFDNKLDFLQRGSVQTDVIIKPGYPRKSIIGNNGDFDLKNSNLFKKQGGKLNKKPNSK